MLVQLLFPIYMNDTDIALTSGTAKFAHDLKLLEVLQKALIKSKELSERWKTPFNCRKCKVLQICEKCVKALLRLLNELFLSVKQYC